MWFPKYFNSLTSTSLRRRPSRRRPPASRLRFEQLEDRRLLTFSPAVTYPVGISPQNVIAADFNNDGRLDVVTANYGSSSMSVLLGNADGTFQPAQNSAIAFGLGSSAVGDFNADGKLDLVNADADYVVVMLGNGNGALQPAGAFNLGSNADSVAVGDFNGDGKLDLGVTSNSSFALAKVLLGDGDGSFAAPIDSFLGYMYHTSVALADFDGDGNLDFATVNLDDGNVAVLQGAGDGRLGDPNSFNFGAYPNAVTAGDVNADGEIDLVTSNTAGNSVSVLLGNGLGSFGAAQIYAAGSQPHSVAMADFNGDGQTDLVTASTSPGTISVLLGASGGTFNPPVTVVAYPFDLAVGDFNGDGLADAVSAVPNSNHVSVLLNDGTWPALDVPSLTINNAMVTEGNTGSVNATFTVSLSAAYGQTVSVHYETAAGYSWNSATAGADYQAIAGTLIFAPGVTSQTVTVLVNGDRLGESHYYSYESFSILLSNPTNAFVADATATGIGIIVDDEPTVSIVDYVEGAEGNTGTTPFAFNVTLSAAYDVPVTVEYATADLTPDQQYWYGPGATAGVDYTATTGTLAIPAGQTSGTIIVLVTGDRIGEGYEAHELFSVNLSNPSGALLSYRQALGAIIDDEPFASINGAAMMLEGNSGTTAMTFTVSLSAVYDADVTVSYVTADLSALAGSDYQAATETVTIPAGQTSQTLTVLVNGDLLAEDDEEFLVTLTGASGLLLYDSSGFATIRDDDTPPTIGIGDSSIVEGNSGTKLMVFTVSLSADYGQPVTVHYQTANGSAAAGSDYTAASGTVTIPAGQTSKTFTIAVKGDRLPEPTETFAIKLSAATNATIVDSQGIGAIVDNEPRVSISDVTKAEGQKGKTTLFTFTVTLSAAYDQAVTMSYRTVNGTGTTGNDDYVAKTGTLTFAPGETMKTITIEVKGDSKKESNETFYLDLFGLSSNALFTKNRGIGTILNDE